MFCKYKDNILVYCPIIIMFMFHKFNLYLYFKIKIHKKYLKIVQYYYVNIYYNIIIYYVNLFENYNALKIDQNYNINIIINT